MVANSLYQYVSSISPLSEILNINQLICFVIQRNILVDQPRPHYVNHYRKSHIKLAAKRDQIPVVVPIE